MKNLHQRELYDQLDIAIGLRKEEEAISILKKHQGEIDVNWLDVDVNWLDEDASEDATDITLLTHAIFNRQEKLIRLLLEAGADPELDGIHFGDPPLIRAIEREMYTRKGTLKVCQMLIDAGANVNQRNAAGQTPLWAASSHDNVDILKLLLDKEANVNAINYEVITPLMRAAEHEMYDNVQILLEYRACVTLKDEQGRTALDYAQKIGNQKIIELLQNAQATKDKKAEF